MFVMLSAILCSVAHAGNEALPGIYHILFLALKTMAGPNVSSTTDTATTLSATINKTGTGYYLTRLTSEAEPTVAEVLAGSSFSMNANKLTTQHVSGLTASTAYKLYFIAKSSSNKVQSTVQNVSFTTGINSAEFTPALNDTGITWGGNYPSTNNVNCTGTEIGAQDCSHGRDFSHNEESDGHAGFSFTKLDENGMPLANQANDYVTTPWACVQDNVTGLVWEVKTTDGGLHDLNDSYFWYNTTSTTNGGMNGYDDSGATCEGYISGNSATYCNTQAYVSRVNAAGWCGKNDWRMPTRTELLGLVSFDRTSPAIDTKYFPHTRLNGVVWSSSPFAFYSNYAWYVGFSGGGSGNVNRDYADIGIRLVRDR